MTGPVDTLLDEVSEADLALLLRITLDDTGLWETLSYGSTGEETCDYRATRAVDLYARTSSLLMRRISASPEPVDYAVGVLREIANALAMLSHPWTDDERQSLGVPDRWLIELAIRGYNIDTWARSQGQPLTLLGVPLGDVETASVEQQISLDDPPEGDFAMSVVRGLGAHADILLLRRTVAGRAFLARDQFRIAACQDIASSRAWVAWSRRQPGPDPEVIAHVLLYVAQAAFCASRERDASTDLFPSLPWLRRALHESSAYGWLVSRVDDIPEWLM